MYIQSHKVTHTHTHPVYIWFGRDSLKKKYRYNRVGDRDGFNIKYIKY